MRFFRTVLAFLRKDFLEAISYRFQIVFEVAAILFTLLLLYVISDFVGDAVSARLEKYGGSFLAFLVCGVAYFNLLDTLASDLSRKVRTAQTLGTLEALLATHAGVPTILLSLPAYTLVKTTLRVCGYFLLGSVIFGLEIRWGNWPGAILIFLLTLVVFGSVGLIFAGLTVVFKKTESFIGMFGTLSAFLGGVFYPVDALPSWLQPLAHLMPITPALDGLRQALLTDGGWEGLLPSVVALIVFALILFPVGAWSFRWALRRAMLDGTLTQY